MTLDALPVSQHATVLWGSLAQPLETLALQAANTEEGRDKWLPRREFLADVVSRLEDLLDLLDGAA